MKQNRNLINSLVGCAIALALVLVAILARARPIAFPLLVAAAAACAGFATITIKSALIAHPVLHHPTSAVAIAGWVEVREERERTDRIVVKVERLESSRRLDEAPERVRVSVRKGQAPPVGAFIEMQARLNRYRIQNETWDETGVWLGSLPKSLTNSKGRN